MRISDWSSDVCSSDLWWSVQKVELQLSGDLGALPQRTRNVVDKVKLSCLLRVADAIHLDSRRAPRFIRTITNPTGVSALHWAFQERIARPHLELDAVVFTAGQPFGRDRKSTRLNSSH